MGLINEYIEVELSSSNMKHYLMKGYDIPKVKSKNGKYVTPRGTKIMVLSNDLMRGSSEKVKIQCDHCKKIYKRHYYEYSYYNHDGLCYCNKCSSTVLQSGENNHGWNHSITKEERENGRYNKKYLGFVRTVFKRDNYTCRCCGSKNNIEAHHLDGFNWCVNRRTDVTNGVTLCSDCHRDFHNKYGIGDNTQQQYEEWIGSAIDLINAGMEITSNRKVYCLETKTVYDSTLDVANLIHVNRTNVATLCSSYKNWKKGINHKVKKSLKGLHFFWYDEYINLSEDEVQSFLKACEKAHYKKVICLTTNKVFDTIKSGADFYGIKSSVGISNCCKGKSLYSGMTRDGVKLKWMYYDDYVKIYKKI